MLYGLSVMRKRASGAIVSPVCRAGLLKSGFAMLFRGLAAPGSYFGPSPGTNELPIRPKSLRIRPQKYLFMPRAILMLPGVKILIKSEKITIFRKINFSEILLFQKSVEKLCK